MKISIIGCGYVGLVTGACLAEIGNQVLCMDLDVNKINLLKSGESPIYEPGLSALIQSNMLAGRIEFTTDIQKSVGFGDLQFIAVGTPPDEDSRADLQYVMEAAKNIAQHMKNFKVIINKSTVPVGTADKVNALVMDELKKRGVNLSFSVVSNPEFLKEGAAITDFMRPDRIVIGTYDDDNGIKARKIMRAIYAPFNRNHDRIIDMNIKSAELTKYAANAMLATRISFMNELANLADQVGADIERVRAGIGSDTRIGHNFLYAGTGYGGSCFPKDVNALIRTAEENRSKLKILEAVHEVNENQKSILIEKIVKKYGKNLSGLKVAVWGLAFKPDTDDMRDAPSRIVIKKLIEMGAKVFAHDPIAIKQAKLAFEKDLGLECFKKIQFHKEMNEVIVNADFLVIITEWKEYRSPDFDWMKKKMKIPVIFDGRNLYEPSYMYQLGIDYSGIGRPLNK